MAPDTKKILGTLAVAAAVGGGFYLISKGKKLFSGAKLNFALLGFQIHKLNLQELQFTVKLRCYNPTKETVSLAVHQAVALYGGKNIAYSTPDIKGTAIQAGTTQDITIRFQVPYLNLIGKGLSIPLLQDSSAFSKNISFQLTLAINGETLTTTQNLTNETMNGLAAPIGQLGIVSGPRNTQNGSRYNHLIKKADGKDLFIKNGDVSSTVESCIEIVADHYREVEELAKHLQADTLKATCRNIFNFSYNYLQYKLDEQGTEQLRTPGRSWLDGQIKFAQHGVKDSGIDCDDYSIFVGSILKNSGIPFKFRITKYDGKQNFQHIYVFVPCEGDSEGEIIIDPVLSKFDFQKPYSFQKSDFNLSAVQLAGGIHGVDGLTGTSALGLPISVLSGFDMGGTQAQSSDYEELTGIVSGIDFEDSINGLGSFEDSTYRYLVRTRDFLLKNKANRSKMAHIQNPEQFIKMLDEAIKHWHTPQREKVLDKLSDIEEKLAENGFIKYDVDALQGQDELDELEDEPDEPEGGHDDELGKSRRQRRRERRRRRRARRKKRGGFFGAIRRIGRKIGKGIKKVGKAVAKAGKKVIKAIIRFNPLSIAVRNGLLAALRLNMFGISKKLQYGYLPDTMAAKHNIDTKKLADLKKRHRRVRKLFTGLQGREKNLRKAILKGAKQRSSDFSLKGMDGILGELQALAAIGELGELGDMGIIATGASVAAASGVLAKISSWLKPVKNIFNKVKNKVKTVSRKISQSKVARRIRKGKAISKQLKQRAAKYIAPLPQAPPQEALPQYIAKQQASYPAPQPAPQPSYTPMLRTGNYKAQPIRQYANSTPHSTTINPTLMPRTPTAKVKKGMSKGAKIGIGVGVLALVGTGIYYATRSKDNKPEAKTKQQLGAIELM